MDDALEELLASNTVQLAQMHKHGDLSSEPRRVEHFSFFNTHDAANAAAEELSAQGYAVEEPADRDGVWVVNFSADSAVDPATVDAFTRSIFAIVKSHDGNYDGWGATVVEDPNRPQGLWARLRRKLE